MSYVAEYERINWENYSSTKTPLNAQNLNKIDYTVKKHDEACVAFDLTKLEKSEALSMLADVTYNSSTGVFTFTRKNGTQIVADINIEKIPVSFAMDANGIITMTTSDGSTYTADVGSLIKKYDFIDSETIDLAETYDSSSKKTKVKAEIINGSVTEEKLQPNFLADCRIAKDNAETASSGAITSALIAEGYSVGEQNGEPVEEGSPYYENNAKYYAEQSGTKTARTIEYDGTASGISANNVQGAIDETVTKVNSKADVSALDAKADKTQLSNRNLLDNGWFNVNQRGLSNYPRENGYCVDRWKRTLYSESVVVNTNGITITRPCFTQYIENIGNLVGKTVTVSLMLQDGTLYVGTKANVSSGVNNIKSFTYNGMEIYLQLDVANGYFRIVSFNEDIAGWTIPIRAVKLELGSISTLANDVTPNYAEELLKCQRYYYRLRSAVGRMYGVNTKAWMTVELPVQMAKVPTLVLHPTNLNVYANGQTTDGNVTSLGSDIYMNDNQLRFFINFNSMGAGASWFTPIIMQAESQYGYIEVSAEL